VSVLAHHGGEGLILTAALGSGVFSGSLIVVRARFAQLARRRWRRRR
jgi:hypothetical protein